jgi:hypothetical protein
MQNLTPGSYFGQLIDSQLGEIGNNGNIAMVLTWDINHYASNGQWKQMDTATRQQNIFLTEKAKERAFSDMKKIGFDGNFENPRFSDECYSGIELVIENETYNGKIYDRVKPAKFVSDSGVKPTSKDKAKLLSAQFRTSVGAASKPSTPPPMTPVSNDPALQPIGSQETPLSKDGLPF